MKMHRIIHVILVMCVIPAACMPQPQTQQVVTTCKTIDVKPLLAKHLVLNCGEGVKMKLVLISPGTFMMGSPDNELGRDCDEGPRHKVTITKPFYMGIYEVTNKQYRSVMGALPPYSKKGEGLPVTRVSPKEIAEFCERLSLKADPSTDLKGDMIIRLPTEAEWEYACRAGAQKRFCCGDSEAELEHYAWFGINSARMQHPVGLKKPNAWGLYDMHGNVWEWCSDWYKNSYLPAGQAGVSRIDPQGPKSGMFRVRRGGSFLIGAQFCRSAYRYWYGVNGGNLLTGFRVVVSKPIAMDR